jgi:hypothetical protein
VINILSDLYSIEMGIKKEKSYCLNNSHNTAQFTTLTNNGLVLRSSHCVGASDCKTNKFPKITQV